MHLVKVQGFTSSAFIQNGKKINPRVFQHLSDVITDNFYTSDNDGLRLWNGFRILAVDGSRITLPNTAELRKCFGAAKNQLEVEIVQAMASVLYDVLNKLTLDAVLDNLGKGEQELGLRHAHRWQKNDLIIYERGYPSYDFMSEHIAKETDYMIRVKTTHGFSGVTSFVGSGKRFMIVELCPKQNKSFHGKSYDKNSRLKIRVVRVDLPCGEVEVLMSTFLDSKKYPSKMFKNLYFLRWGVETFYNELKNKLKVEHFTGYSENTIR